MKVRKILMLLCAAGAAAVPAYAAVPRGRITGVGGVFFRSKDPKALIAWYRDVLGVTVQPWGGVTMAYDAPGHPPVVTINVFGTNSRYMSPSTREFMLNFAVDDLSAFLDRRHEEEARVARHRPTAITPRASRKAAACGSGSAWSPAAR